VTKIIRNLLSNKTRISIQNGKTPRDLFSCRTKDVTFNIKATTVGLVLAGEHRAANQAGLQKLLGDAPLQWITCWVPLPVSRRSLRSLLETGSARGPRIGGAAGASSSSASRRRARARTRRRARCRAPTRRVRTRRSRARQSYPLAWRRWMSPANVFGTTSTYQGRRWDSDYSSTRFAFSASEQADQ